MMSWHSRGIRAAFLAPARAIAGGLIAAPLAVIAGYSILTRGAYGGTGPPWTLESYARLADPLYLTIFARSFALAALATLVCAVLAFPAALFIARAGHRKRLYVHLVMLPFWTSFLVRTYAWMFLLRDTGLFNSALMGAGLIREPLPLLYNDFAVLLGLVYGYLPFMVLPVYVAIERLDPSLLDAAADLGARPWTALTRVVLPLSSPGIRAGAVLVFIPSLGAYLTPDLLGGGKTVLIGNLVQNQFTSARDWPFGSAVSMLLTVLTIGMLALCMRRNREGIA